MAHVPMVRATMSLFCISMAIESVLGLVHLSKGVWGAKIGE